MIISLAVWVYLRVLTHAPHACHAHSSVAHPPLPYPPLPLPYPPPLSPPCCSQLLTDYIGGENYEEACHALAIRKRLAGVERIADAEELERWVTEGKL